MGKVYSHIQLGDLSAMESWHYTYSVGIQGIPELEGLMLFIFVMEPW